MKALMIHSDGKLTEYQKTYARLYGLVFLYFSDIQGKATLVVADTDRSENNTHEKLLALVRKHFNNNELRPIGAGRYTGALKSWRSVGLRVWTPDSLILPIANALGITP